VDNGVKKCPSCGEELRSGWIGERGWIRWYDSEPRRRFRTILSLGEKLLKFNYWGVWTGVVRAERCPKCDLVIFRGETQKP
jgi:hypothetical protein